MVMLNSGVSASSLIANLQLENDIALPISNATYTQWLNELQQLLYREIIKEPKKATGANQTAAGLFDLSTLTIATDEATVEFEDVYKVFITTGGSSEIPTELVKMSLDMADAIPYIYFKENNKLGFRPKETSWETIIIYYHVRPKLVAITAPDTIGTGNIMVPHEFLDIVTAKLRGEAYRLTNEDIIAANWLNVYNQRLSDLRTWCESKRG